MSDPFTAEWLREIAPEVVDTLRQASEPNFFGDGSIVYPLDGEPPWLWGVQSGYVRYFATYDEVGPTLCHIFGPGSWFGIARMARRNPTTEEARAATDTTLVRVHKSTFRQLATRHPALWEAAIQLMAMVRVPLMRTSRYFLRCSRIMAAMLAGSVRPRAIAAKPQVWFVVPRCSSSCSDRPAAS